MIPLADVHLLIICNFRDPIVSQDIQEEKGIKFVYEIYEKR